MPQLAAITIGFEVQHQPHAQAERSIDVHLLTAQQRNIDQTECPGRCCRWGASEVGRGGEENADDVVVGEIVAFVQRLEQPSRLKINLLRRVMVERDGTTQSKNGHGDAGYRSATAR